MVISLYAHGMSNRDIICHLRQVYGTGLSPATISAVTDAVLEGVKAWQARPLDPAYAVVFLDATVVKVRDIIKVEDKRAREREARCRETSKRPDQPARIVEGQRVTGWRVTGRRCRL
jgi:hypothetical protein